MVINSVSRFADRVLILGDGLLAEPLSRNQLNGPSSHCTLSGTYLNERMTLARLGGWMMPTELPDLTRYVRSHRVDPNYCSDERPEWEVAG